jgi:hypothetical protein
MVLVVVVNLALEQFIGWVNVPDFLIPQEGHQASLERTEEPFDFALGLRRGGHAMIDAQGAQRALELGHSVQAVMSRSMAKEAQPIGIEAGWTAEPLEGGAQVAEVAPGGVDIKAASHNLA